MFREKSSLNKALTESNSLWQKSIRKSIEQTLIFNYQLLGSDVNEFTE